MLLIWFGFGSFSVLLGFGHVALVGGGGQDGRPHTSPRFQSSRACQASWCPRVWLIRSGRLSFRAICPNLDHLPAPMAPTDRFSFTQGSFWHLGRADWSSDLIEDHIMKNHVDLVVVSVPSIVDDPPEVHYEIGSSWSAFDMPLTPWFDFSRNMVLNHLPNWFKMKRKKNLKPPTLKP